MAGILTFAMASAALLFIVLSATVNALFLSSIGRTPVEIALLAALSIAADVAKAGLPVVTVRAALVRAWGHLIAATLMLALVVMLSLASGIGFAALTRNAATSVREAKAQQVATWRRDLIELDAQLQRLSPGRSICCELVADGVPLDACGCCCCGCVQDQDPRLVSELLNHMLNFAPLRFGGTT